MRPTGGLPVRLQGQGAVQGRLRHTRGAGEHRECPSARAFEAAGGLCRRRRPHGSSARGGDPSRFPLRRLRGRGHLVARGGGRERRPSRAGGGGGATPRPVSFESAEVLRGVRAARPRVSRHRPCGAQAVPRPRKDRAAPRSAGAEKWGRRRRKRSATPRGAEVESRRLKEGLWTGSRRGNCEELLGNSTEKGC